MKKEHSTIDKAQSEFKNAQIFVSKKAVKRLKAVMSPLREKAVIFYGCQLIVVAVLA
tara:strand:- start:204 stop:374 length:171 start_codon:yes stop_codon:yes gene_type:complete